jgi:hypothetical protein
MAIEANEGRWYCGTAPQTPLSLLGKQVIWMDGWTNALSRAMFACLGVMLMAGGVLASDPGTHVLGVGNIVPMFCETSVSTSEIVFGVTNPGSMGVPMAGGFVSINVTPNTNADVDTFLKATNLTSGMHSIYVGNMSVAKQDGGETTRFSDGWLLGPNAGQGYVNATPKGGAFNLWFFLDVPSSTEAGDYSGTLTISSVASGHVPN